MKNYVLTLGLLLFGMIAMAQESSISGKITDASGTPLQGVNVIEKGTTNGAITDGSGKYTINASQEAILIFSFVGYTTQEIAVGDQKTIDVLLQEEAYALNEAVVTALGITKSKKSIGYSTQEVDVENLSKTNVQNVGNLLTGKVAGLSVSNPTGLFQAPSFSLRGRDPLIVIDGIPMETDFFEVDANDVANINVLKGVTASALYGSRGRDGAILITTKKATEEGLRVSVTNSTMVTAGYTVYPETQNEYGNGSNGKYEFWDGKDGGISDGDMVWGPAFADNLKIEQWNSPIRDKVSGEVIDWYGDVSGTKYDDRSRYERVPIDWKWNDFLDEFLETGLVTKTSFSLAYKNEKVSHRFSGNYAYQKGQVPNTELQTGGVKLLSTYHLTKALTLDTKFSYDKVYSPNYPRYGYGPKNHMYTILIWMGWDVNADDMSNHLWVPGQEGYRQANFNYAWYNNPFFAAEKLNQKYNKDLYTGQAALTYDITKDLTIKGSVAAVRQDRFENRESPKSYLNYGDPRDGDYKTWNRDWTSLNNDILATYRKQVSAQLNFTLNAGASNFYHRFEEYYNASDGLVVPDVYSLNNTKNPVKAETYVQEKGINSAYASANFDVMDAFFFNFSARNDWSSTLSDANDSYFYPSASLSTVVSNLINMPSAVNYVKLYGSWASVRADLAPKKSPSESKIETSNTAYRAASAGFENPYQLQSYYSNSGSYNGSTMLSYPSGIVNPGIQANLSVSFELGLSTAFLNNRLAADFTYYNVVESDNILNLPVANSSGFESRKVNDLEFTTNGLELSVNAIPVRTRNLQWKVGFNWDKRITKLTNMENGDKYGNISIGERTDNYYTTGWMKSPDGKVIVNESTGLPIKDDYPQLFGHTGPNWSFGFQNSVKYKDFTFEMDIDGVVGGVMWSRTVEKMWWGGKHPNSTKYRDEDYFNGIANYTPDAVNVVSGELVQDTDGNVLSDTRVFKENTTKLSWQTWSQNYPYRARVGEEESEFFANVLDRSFLKVRRLAVTYDLSQTINSKSIKGLQLTAYAYNLLIFKKAMIVDPDFGHDSDLQDPSSRYVGMSVTLNL